MKTVYMLPMPKLTKETLSFLTEGRQQVILKLLNSDLPFSRLAEQVGFSPSSLTEALSFMEKNQLVGKTDLKTYKLTRDGKLLGLMLMRPNGKSEEEIQHSLQRLLEEEFGVKESEARDEIIDGLRCEGKNWTDMAKNAKSPN